MSLPSGPPQISVWELWSECAKQSDTLGDALFLECLDAASNSRIFDDLTDDKLKTSLSIINSLLNDPKTKPKGLTLFCDLASQINPSRLIGFQDAVISSLHLIVKSLDSSLANTALVNQVVTSSIVPKLLSYFVEENQSSLKTVEEFALLKVCLTEYHGPCGHFREKLEKSLMPLIDSENTELIQVISEVMPLLSYAGGGGNAAEKHIKDWNTMLTKCLKTAYSTMIQMYGDSLTVVEPDNPFDGDQLTGLKRISESQVLRRFSLLKRRLQNLLSIISGYLRFPFPAPKMVPQKGILKLITGLTSAIPYSNSRNSHEKTQRKENVFLIAITPGVHMMAFTLMKSLFDCVGSNVFTEGTRVEQIFSSEFKWFQEKPRAFEQLKLELYDTVRTWLALTRGTLTSLKTMTLWIDVIGQDTRVEKDIVELKILSKQKPGKSVKLMNTSSMTLSSGSATQVFVSKSPEVCQIALKTLISIIPALDKDNHRKIYEHLLKTSSIICQFQCPPSPYNNSDCRKLVYENLTELCNNPHSQSPISVALTATLLRRGMQDPTNLVSSFCANKISQLERLLHPNACPLILAGPAPHPVILDNYNSVEFTTNRSEQDDDCSVNSDNDPSQSEFTLNRTAEVENTTQNSASLNSLDQELLAVFKEQMEQTLKNILSSRSMLQDYKESKELSRGNSRESSSKQPDEMVSAQSGSTLSSSNFPSELQRSNANLVTLPDSDDEEMEQQQSEADMMINGNGHHSEVEFEDKDEQETAARQIPEDDIKRKAAFVDGSDEQTSKKCKTTSPSKESSKEPAIELVEGPSVDEMLSTFVDVEPIS